MADAIIPVPIYDPQYQQLANLVLNAKSVKSYSGNIPYSNNIQNIYSWGSFPITDPFNIAIIMQFTLAGSAILCQYRPAHILIPNANKAYLPTVSSQQSISNGVFYYTDTNTLYLSQAISSGSVYSEFLIAIIE